MKFIIALSFFSATIICSVEARTGVFNPEQDRFGVVDPEQERFGVVDPEQERIFKLI